MHTTPAVRTTNEGAHSRIAIIATCMMSVCRIAIRKISYRSASVAGMAIGLELLWPGVVARAC